MLNFEVPYTLVTVITQLGIPAWQGSLICVDLARSLGQLGGTEDPLHFRSAQIIHS